ncbi:Phosphotransferase enzyme family protein [Arthrobacter sp. yr096]|uniref:phosphotransferase family protein n=1 Tax=Arthrobacter sp. yr096 TaxID=1761750 RepID=UPI0008BF2F82|nr:phosphotransferase [Arthrobacter sp. yr096]SEJ40660.1 Phosphotransferase enzyme family protein [Arthrobacter sp. yr096]
MPTTAALNQSAESTTAGTAFAVAARRCAESVRLAGAGTEFDFYEATLGGNREGYRIPRSVEFNTANNRGVSARMLQHQEMAMARWAAENGIPTACVVDLVEQNDSSVLILEVMDDDGTELDSAALGSVVAAMHRQPCPNINLVAQHGMPLAARLVHRLKERYTELRNRHVLPALPDAAALHATIENNIRAPRLTHLDLRRQNVRVLDGVPSSIFDWSNALLAPPEMELARLEEYSIVEENGINFSAFLDGYTQGGGSIDVGSAAWPLLRLDAAVMLAIVFDSVAPNPGVRDCFLSRIKTLVGQL